MACLYAQYSFDPHTDTQSRPASRHKMRTTHKATTFIEQIVCIYFERFRKKTQMFESLHIRQTTTNLVICFILCHVIVCHFFISEIVRGLLQNTFFPSNPPPTPCTHTHTQRNFWATYWNNAHIFVIVAIAKLWHRLPSHDFLTVICIWKWTKFVATMYIINPNDIRFFFVAQYSFFVEKFMSSFFSQ